MNPIGVFDSGLGGLTVIRELILQLPHEPIVYFGDTARVPYGNKSRETVIRYALEIGSFLSTLNAKLLVVACNTVSALAIDSLRERFSIPVVDVIEPIVEIAASKTRTGHIAVLGTKGTIRSGVYQERFQTKFPEGRVIAIPCPLFVPLVEEGLQSHRAAIMIAEEYLRPLQKERVDTVVLGCTHYPFLKETIRKVLGEETIILDSAKACAEKVERELLYAKIKSPFSGKVQIKYFVSDDSETFRSIGEQFLGAPLDSVEQLVPAQKNY